MKNSILKLGSYLSIILSVFYILTKVHALADIKYKTCWDVSFEDESMFCHGAVSKFLDFCNSVLIGYLASE